MPAQDLKLRHDIVNYVAYLADMHQLHNMTVHVAVAYLDRVRARANIPKRMIPLLAATCLLISAKFEEAPMFVPTLSGMVASMDNPSITTQHLADSELEVLKLLDWRLCVATRLHFIQAFRTKGLVSSCDIVASLAPTEDEQAYIWKLVVFFCNIMTLLPEFVHYGTELSAAAAIAAARKVSGVYPVWPDELAERFGHSEAIIAACCHELCEWHETTNVADMPTAESSSPTNVDVPLF